MKWESVMHQQTWCLQISHWFQRFIWQETIHMWVCPWLWARKCDIRPHQVIYLSYGCFWDWSRWGWQNKNNNISEKLASSEAHLRPSCSPVTHQEVLCAESLKTEWHWTTKEGDERDTRGNAAGIIHKFYIYFNFPGFKCGRSVRQIYNLVWP